MMVRWFALAFGVGLALAIAGAASTAQFGTSTPAATPFDCPITVPGGKQPPEVANLGRMDGFGNDALWASLVMWSEKPGIVMVPDDDHLQPDGRVIEMKWAWYRYQPGTLEIGGRRLDAPAPPLEAWIPDGYGDRGFQVSGITFPSNGCWEITGRVGERCLTFVVLVVWPEDFTPHATPRAEASPVH